MYSRRGGTGVQGVDGVLFKLLGKEQNYLKEVDYLYYRRVCVCQASMPVCVEQENCMHNPTAEAQHVTQRSVDATPVVDGRGDRCAPWRRPLANTRGGLDSNNGIMALKSEQSYNRSSW